MAHARGQVQMQMEECFMRDYDQWKRQHGLGDKLAQLQPPMEAGEGVEAGVEEVFDPETEPNASVMEAEEMEYRAQLMSGKKQVDCMKKKLDEMLAEQRELVHAYEQQKNHVVTMDLQMRLLKQAGLSCTLDTIHSIPIPYH